MSIRSFIRPSIRPSLPISNLLLLLNRRTEWNFQELFTTWCHTARPILNFYPHDFGVSHSKTRTLPLRHMGGGASLICYSSKNAEQNLIKLSGIVHYMMPYCTSYFKFLSAWFWGFPELNKDFAITTYGGGDPSLICHFTTWCHTAPPILNFYSNAFGVSQSKTRTLPYKTWGSGGYHFVSISHSIINNRWCV